MATLLITDDPRLTEERVGITNATEREVRRAAAIALGVRTLRGLSQAATEHGVRYYAPGADDYDGRSVEIVY